ncbi:TIM44-like domain-containing protein [Streptococcus parasanguinis]|uniref:TIM44-like domain-containing protein n=1 Tax=Streptococcus parasanguinis TaxID=1318 RepID=UPI00066A15B1|nr:TIM44-like domain-containing protein [Streptococcus parasanguinis]MDU5787411.1 TIM44-like domain-containing protein [Streptococcus parasanguinis]
MKKRSVIVGILLVVLLFVFAPSAHAGVGNTDSGGSSLIDSGGGSSWSDSGSSWSDGGSSWSGGSSSYSSGSGTDSGGVVAVFAIVGLIGFIYNIAKEANDSDESFSSNSGPKRTTEERAGRPIENNYEAIRRIRKLDPMFDEDRFLSQVKLVYLQLQSAWTEKDWNSVRNLESTSLYEQHLTQLQEHIRAKTTNVLERVRVEDSKIKDFIENPEGNDRIEVILSSTMRDYIRNDETGRVIEGDPTKDLFTVYRMVFLREHGAQTEIIKNSEVVSDHCPNCGAPLTIDSIDKCEYCQASLKHNPKDWVLDAYEVVDEIEFYR